MTRFVLCGALLIVRSLSAQDSDKAMLDKKIAEVKMQTGSFQVMSDQMLSGKTVKGAPYSAQALNETVQVLADGNRISRSVTSMLYRDSQGRERREESSNGTVRSIFISDPVDGVNYTLETHHKVARKNTVDSLSTTVSNARMVREDAEKLKTLATESRILTMTSGGGPMTINFSSHEFNSSKLDSKEENLGMQVIEGVAAEGTRTTVTIPAGQIGNEQPILIVTERWFSPDLQVVVMTKRSDPRTGTMTYKLTGITRSEPAATLFQVPADYTVAEPEMIKRMLIKEDQQ